MLVTPDTLVYRRQHDKERDLPVSAWKQESRTRRIEFDLRLA